MEEKQIYISFEEPEYRENKKELLLCQKNIIDIQKKLRTLSAVRSQKRRLIAQLYKIVSGAVALSERIDAKLPDGTVPKNIQFKERKQEKNIPSKKDLGEDFKVDDLDKELRDIQKKIEELNKR